MLSTRTFALLFLAWLALACAVLTIGGESADASTGAQCHAYGRAVTLADARHAPDFRAPLVNGESADLPQSLAFASDVHAYPLHGGSARAYRCHARGMVDLWTEYRSARGTVLATFDGVTFHARRSIVATAWMG